VKKTINLLDELLRESRPRHGKWTLAAAVGVGILMPFLVWGVQVRAAARLDPQIMQLKSARDRLAHEVSQLREGFQEDDAQRVRLMTERIQTTGARWSEILRELSLVVPDGVWLAQFEEKVRQETSEDIPVRIQGVAGSQGGVAEFLASLETARHFSQPQLVYSQRENGSTNRVGFEIHCVIARASFFDPPPRRRG
jgi:Tfp pilus assembly protein PilN